MASVAKLTALSKPKTVRRAGDVVVDRLGHADNGDAAGKELVADGQRAVATDDDQGVEREPVAGVDAPLRVVHGLAVALARVGEGVAAVGGAEDGAADPQDAGHVLGQQHARAVGVEQPVEAVLQAQDPDSRVDGGLDDGPDDRVEAGGVAAARQDTDALDVRHAAQYSVGRER